MISIESPKAFKKPNFSNMNHQITVLQEYDEDDENSKLKIMINTFDLFDPSNPSTINSCISALQYSIPKNIFFQLNTFVLNTLHLNNIPHELVLILLKNLSLIAEHIDIDISAFKTSILPSLFQYLPQKEAFNCLISLISSNHNASEALILSFSLLKQLLDWCLSNNSTIKDDSLNVILILSSKQTIDYQNKNFFLSLCSLLSETDDDDEIKIIYFKILGQFLYGHKEIMESFNSFDKIDKIFTNIESSKSKFEAAIKFIKLIVATCSNPLEFLQQHHLEKYIMSALKNESTEFNGAAISMLIANEGSNSIFWLFKNNILQELLTFSGKKPRIWRMALHVLSICCFIGTPDVIQYLIESDFPSLIAEWFPNVESETQIVLLRAINSILNAISNNSLQNSNLLEIPDFFVSQIKMMKVINDLSDNDDSIGLQAAIVKQQLQGFTL